MNKRQKSPEIYTNTRCTILLSIVAAIFSGGFDCVPCNVIFFFCGVDGQENEKAGERVPVMEDSLWWLQQESHWHGGRCKKHSSSVIHSQIQGFGRLPYI